MLADIVTGVTVQHISACHMTTKYIISTNVWDFDWINITKTMRQFPNSLANGNVAVDKMADDSLMSL